MNIRRASGRLTRCLLPLLGFAAIGCASTSSKPVDARAAGEWTFRLPETRSPYASLAVARGTDAELAKLTADEGAEVQAGTPERKVKPRPTSRVQKAAPAVPKTVEPQPTAPEPQPVVTPSPELLAVNTPAPTTQPASEDARRYAGREANADRQRQYRGGDAIVISVSALLIILLVVLLILLLT